ncbi:MAG: glycosyltransferase family 39 protein [Actinomycetes bacterium]
MSASAQHPQATAERLRGLLSSPIAVGIYLVGLTLASVWFRTRSADAAFWMDEGLSVGIASHALFDIPSVLKQDGSPPLYYMGLAAWMGWFGRTEAATHAFSLLASTATIPFAFWAGRTLFDRRTGVIAASVFASSAFLTAYSQETRMYALMVLLSLTTATFFLLSFVARRRPWLAAFVVSMAAMLYTHGWGIFYGVGCFVALMFLAYRDSEGRAGLLKDGALSFGAVALLFVPWLPTLLYQARNTAAPWALSPGFGLPLELSFLLGGQRIAIALLLASALGFWRIVSRNGEGVPPVPGPAVAMAEGLHRRAVAALLLIFGVTIAIGWTLSQFNPAWALRYLSAILGVLLFAFAICAARSGWLGIAGIAFVVFAGFSPSINLPINLKSNMRNIGTEVNPRLKPGALVIVGQPEQVPLAWYYLPGGMRFADPMGPTSDPRMLNWVKVVDRLRAAEPRRTYDQLVESVPVGGQVLLIRPLTVGIMNWSAPWTFEVRRRSAQWSELLQRDPRFVKEVASPWFYIPASTVANSAVLYRRTRAER